jgi:hypothetical protein
LREIAARQQYARAAERLAKGATPITDRAALAKRLNLTAERFGVIKTGDQVTGPIVLAFDQGSDSGEILLANRRSQLTDSGPA